MRHLLWIFAIGAALGFSLGTAHAQDQKLEPILVFTATSYQNTLADIDYLATVTENRDLFKSIDATAGTLLQVKDLHLGQIEGLDKTRPYGAAVLTDGLSIMPMTFLPIEGELEPVFKSLAPLLGEAKAEDGGIYAVGQGSLAGFVKAENGWAYFAQMKEHLAVLPDPAALFGKLPESYDAAVQVNFQKIPEGLRQLASDQLRVALEAADTKKPDESDPMFAFRQAIGEFRSKLVDRGINETEQVTFGMTIDADAKRGRGELIVKPLAESPLATHFASLKEVKSKFGGVLEAVDERPIVHMNMTGTLEPAMVSQLTSQLAAYRGAVLDTVENSSEIGSDEERQVFKELSTGLIDVIQASLETGQLDLAVRISGKPALYNMVAAIRVTRGADLANLFQRVGTLATEDKNFTSVKLNVAEHQGAIIHALTLKSSPETAPLDFLFNKKLTMYVTATEDAAWLAMGPNAIDQLKKALEGTETSAQPLHAKVSLVPIFRLMGQTTQEQQMQMIISVMALQLQKLDLMEVTGQVDEGGNLHVHIETEQGFMRLVTVVVSRFLPMLMQGGNTPGSGPPF